MIKILLGILLCSTVVAAEPQTYHSLPDPSYQLVTLGKRVVIQDARGFFFGYYTPLPTPGSPFVPTAPQARSGLYTGLNGDYSSVFSTNPSFSSPAYWYSNWGTDSGSNSGYDCSGISDFSQWSSNCSDNCVSPGCGSCP